MATASKSAANAVINIFGTVTTAANAVTTAVTVAGNAFEVLNLKSNDWLVETREGIELNGIDRSLRLRDEAANSMATRLVERAKVMGETLSYRDAYRQAMKSIEGFYAAKQDQQQAA